MVVMEGFYLWNAANRFGHHGDVKIFLMASLQWVPLAGSYILRQELACGFLNLYSFIESWR
jgi:hypothetical protein